jgi:hypothetical protein
MLRTNLHLQNTFTPLNASLPLSFILILFSIYFAILLLIIYFFSFRHCIFIKPRHPTIFCLEQSSTSRTFPTPVLLASLSFYVYGFSSCFCQLVTLNTHGVFTARANDGQVLLHYGLSYHHHHT